MKAKFLKITAAATTIALALTLSAVSSAAETSDNIPEDSIVIHELAAGSGFIDASESEMVVLTNEDIAEYQKYFEVYEEAYKRALKEELANADYEEFYRKMEAGEYTADPARVATQNAVARAEKECAAKGRSINKSFELTKRANFTAFPIYEGSWGVPSIKDTSLPFVNPPAYFECAVGKKDNNSIQGFMETINSAYNSSYKYISVTLTYTDGTTKIARNHSTSSSCSVVIPNSDKTIQKAIFHLYLYENSDSASDVKECVIVTLTRDN